MFFNDFLEFKKEEKLKRARPGEWGGCSSKAMLFFTRSCHMLIDVVSRSKNFAMVALSCLAQMANNTLFLFHSCRKVNSSFGSIFLEDVQHGVSCQKKKNFTHVESSRAHRTHFPTNSKYRVHPVLAMYSLIIYPVTNISNSNVFSHNISNNNVSSEKYIQ